MGAWPAAGELHGPIRERVLARVSDGASVRPPPTPTMNSPNEAERTRGRVARALEHGDLDLAFRELGSLEQDIDREAPTAALWLDLLRVAPRRPQLEGEVTRILARWPEDAQLVTRGCDALIRRAELAPPDEPAPERERLARAAERAAERCLSLQPQAQDVEMRAFLLSARGNALRLCGDHEGALACLRSALEASPQRGGFWFNLGLLHKAQHSWSDALTAFQRACELLGEERGVLWNLAICATALGDGSVAVDALRKLGHAATVSERGMPYVPDLPPVRVRVATMGSGVGTSAVPDRSVGFELLWVTPLSPCHGVVSSASYRDASTDYGDVVLWDGVPVGVTQHDGKQVPRFPLLAVLRKGDEHRLRFVALQQAEGQVEALAAELGPGTRLFIHQERIEKLCARCASGEHMRKHEHEPPEEHRLVQGKIVLDGGVDLPAFRRALEANVRRHSGVQLVVPRLLELVGDTAAAGVAHRLWRALSRLD